MKLFVLGAALGLAVGFVATCKSAQVEPSEDVQAAADEAGVDAIDLLGAVNTTGLGPRDYLIAVGELHLSAHPPLGAVGAESPVQPAGLLDWPIGGPLGRRIYCIEGIESRHGAAMWNPVDIRGVRNGPAEHAQGFLGFLPSTARSVGAIIGNRWSEWQAAAWMLAHDRGREFYGIAAGRC